MDDSTMSDPVEPSENQENEGARGLDNPSEELEWSAFYDDQGKLYYYNSKTEASSWDPPEDGRFNPPPAKEDDAIVAPEAEEEKEEVSASISTDAAPTWMAYKADDGTEYFYNSLTGETQWDRPDDFVDTTEVEQHAEEATEKELVEPDDKPTPSDDAATRQSPPPLDETDDKLEETTTQPEEDKIDPAVKRLQDARDALARADSVLEPKVIDLVTAVVTGDGGNPQNALSTLIDSFQGQTVTCGLLARWLADLRSEAAPAQQELPQLSDNPSQKHADHIRKTAEDIICNIAEERFNKDTGDSILKLSKSEAAFLREMMDSPRWRRLLIDLSARHKDSALLVYCLKAISKKGHHREIAKRISQSEHFAVFNAMLLSELAVIGECAVSAGSDAKSAIGLDELVSDLLKACSSTSYTYLYSVELLKHLSRQVKDLERSSSHRLCRALRKWAAIAQKLEGVMIDPTSTSESASSPLLRKRKLDIALIISDLQQGRRKRMRMAGMVEDDSLVLSFLKFIRRYASGIKIDDPLLTALIPQGLNLDATKAVGDMLTQHPVAIRALLAYLFLPGSNRLTVPSVRNKCARLIAIATVTAQKKASEQAGDNAIIEVDDEVSLTEHLLQGSLLCEQVETMISFLVSTTDATQGGSAGQKLSRLALESPPVALGVIIWAKEFTYGKEFADSASFPTLSGSVLSLVRAICLKHPFTRPDGAEIAFRFLSHSNPDVSYKKINAIKEQSLRLLLFLLTKGEVARIIGGLVRRLEVSSDLDASLIRYVVGGIVDVVEAPVSLMFARSFASLLTTSKCLDAVRSTYFGDNNRLALSRLLTSFKDIQTIDGKKLDAGDNEMISSVLYAYDIQ